MPIFRHPDGFLIRLRDAEQSDEDTGLIDIRIPFDATTAVLSVGEDVPDGQRVKVVSQGRTKTLLTFQGSITVPLTYWWPGGAPNPAVFWVQVIAAQRSKPKRFSVTPEPPPLGVPVELTPPTATNAVIGQTPQVTFGTYSNMEGLSPTVEILLDDVVVAQNTNYTFDKLDDGKEFVFRVTATNASGSAISETDPITVAFPKPGILQPFNNPRKTVGDPVLSVRASDYFYVIDPEGDAETFEGVLTYAISGVEATIDPVTSAMVVGYSTPRTNSVVTVSVTNSGGTTEQTFVVNVTDVVVEPVVFPPPIADNLWNSREKRDAAPARRRTIDVDPSVVVPSGLQLVWYSGTINNVSSPPPAFTVVTPGVNATTVGTYPLDTTLYDTIHWYDPVTQTAAPAYITQRQYVIKGLYPAPVKIQDIPPQSAVVGGANLIVAAAESFYPTSDLEGSTFGVAGAGASINAATGRVTLDVSVLRTNVTVTVTATNAAGSAVSSFLFNVVSDTGVTPFPANLSPSDWEDGEVRTEAPSGRMRVLVRSGYSVPAGFILRWSPTTNPAGVFEWSKVVTPGVEYITASTSATGTVIYSRLFWERDDGSGDYDYASEVRTHVIQGLTEPPTGLPALPDSAISSAVASGLLTITETGSYGAGRSPANEGHCPAALAYTVFRGGASSTVINRLKAQIDNALTGNKCALALSGYSANHDMKQTAMFAFVRNTPSIWNDSSFMTNAKKQKMSNIMEACACSGAYASSDTNPDTAAGRSIDDLAGYSKYRRTWAANFRMAMFGQVMMAIPFFQSSAAVQALLDNLNVSDLRARLNNTGCTNTYKIWSQIGSGGDAPSISEVQQAVRGWKMFGRNANQHVAMILSESAKLWPHKIKPGWGDNGQGVQTPTRGLRGILMSGAGTLPNLNKRAMTQELNTSDGGAPCNNNKGSPRSSMSYSISGTQIEMSYLLVMAATGYISRESPGLHDNLPGETFSAYERFVMGWEDMQYRTLKGYKSTAKGDCSTNREDWTADFAQTKWRIDVTWALFDVVKQLLAPV